MTEKTKWFEEVFAADPTSKIFLSYAKALVAEEDFDKAITVLRRGLETYPEHAEARMMLINLLLIQNQKEDAKVYAKYFADILDANPGFWTAMSSLTAGNGKEDSLYFALLDASTRGRNVTISSILRQGLMSSHVSKFSSSTTPAKFTVSPTPVPTPTPAPVKVQSSVEYTITSTPAPTSQETTNTRTRTMADLLFGQGDMTGALEIYKELNEKNPDNGYIRHQIEFIEKKLAEAVTPPQEEAPSNSSNNSEAKDPKSILARLAERLEARAGQ